MTAAAYGPAGVRNSDGRDGAVTTGNGNSEQEFCRAQCAPCPSAPWTTGKEAATWSRSAVAERAPYPYAEFSELAGPLQAPPADGRVRFRPVARGWARFRAWLLVVGAFTFELVFLIWLLQPAHYPEFLGDWRSVLSRVLLVSVGVIGALQIVNVTTLAIATLQRARPDSGDPSGRPARRLPHHVRARQGAAGDGDEDPGGGASGCATAACCDVWLLDEGDDPAVKAMCAELGVHHFTRKGVPELEPGRGARTGRETKHGNYNAWLDAHGDGYDYLASVDTDHVPLPNYPGADARLLPRPGRRLRHRPAGVRQLRQRRHQGRRVAAVPVPRADPAGGQPATARRCSSAPPTPSASRRCSSIGGLHDSITEDMATGFELHRARNPQTGARWQSVYTPGRARRRRGPGDLAGLLHPAASLGVRRRTRPSSSSSGRGFWRLVLAGKAALRDAAGLLPDRPRSTGCWAALKLVAVPVFGASGAWMSPAECG